MFNFFNLKNTISENSTADPEDVVNTKQTLQQHGQYDPPDWGITETPTGPCSTASNPFNAKTFGLKPGKKKRGLGKGLPMNPWNQAGDKLLESAKKTRSVRDIRKANLKFSRTLTIKRLARCSGAASTLG